MPSALKRMYHDVSDMSMPVKRKRTVSKATGLTGPVSAKIRSAVRKAIVGAAEKKNFVAYAANQSITTAAATFPFGVYLTPQIGQGGGDGQRIANRVKVLSSNLRLCVNLLPYNATTNPLPVPLLVRILIVGYKKANQGVVASTDLSTAIWEVNSGVTGFQGNPLDITFKVNDQSYTTFYDTVIKLGAAGTSTTTPVSSGSYFDSSNMTMFLDIDVPTAGPLVYNDTTNVPTNKNRFLIIQPVTADGSACGSYTMAECHYAITTTYVDL